MSSNLQNLDHTPVINAVVPTRETQVSRRLCSFGDGERVTAANGADPKIFGGKGANLVEMSRLGLPVPPGFTICTDECLRYLASPGRLSDDLMADVEDALSKVGSIVGRKFGDSQNPLLVSVRSGARASMPGMMDTVLNLGLNDVTVQGLAKCADDARFAWDSYRRFIQMYGDVVLGVSHSLFEHALEEAKADRGLTEDTQVDVALWKDIVARYLIIVEAETGMPFPQDPSVQLEGAIRAVFLSWQSDRARTYRNLHNIPHGWGTAVTVQAMVFGNMGGQSATGVAFTRNPSTGERRFYGEWLPNAQGEDVVAGIRTPQCLTRTERLAADSALPSMEEEMPAAYAAFAETLDLLEQHYRDMQDVEFTVERGKLWLLQTRSGKRTASAALRIAVEMTAEGMIDKRDAVARIDPMSLDQMLHPILDPTARRDIVARGLAASPGAASGTIVLTAEAAVERAGRGDSVILVRAETSPEDIHGMHAAKGILTKRGGMTSHAAVVARGMGRPCVSGVNEIMFGPGAAIRIGDRPFSEGDWMTIDGSTGDVIAGAVPTIDPEPGEHFETLMGWADSFRRMSVRSNAETPADCRVARQFGAEGIGLCRTEHMFFEEDRIFWVRQMIMADNDADRRQALARLLPEQRSDFAEIFAVMDGLPVNIRLLDPPLHEFLPGSEQELGGLADAMGVAVDSLRTRIASLAEANPMLGHRGCRLAISYPEIYEMQTRALFEAAIDAVEQGFVVLPEIMVPLIVSRKEVEVMKALVDGIAETVFKERGRRIDYQVGTMIELPRAALVADEIAEVAEFFSFGTNDLTQTTLGLSRDDAGKFLPDYCDKDILPHDPFVSIDLGGVGQLVDLAVRKGRVIRPGVKSGVCGEHGGDPNSITFFERVGLDYISASPFRIPVARLAAAHATINANRAEAN